MEEQRFYICEICGNQVGMIKNNGPKVHCCNKPMTPMQPSTEDTLFEKHIPDVKIDGTTVTVNIGEIEHPMVENHYIEWIYLLTDKSGHRKILGPNDSPSATFNTDGEKPVCVFAHCNIHGLFKKSL